MNLLVVCISPFGIQPGNDQCYFLMQEWEPIFAAMLLLLIVFHCVRAEGKPFVYTYFYEI